MKKSEIILSVFIGIALVIGVGGFVASRIGKPPVSYNHVTELSYGGFDRQRLADDINEQRTGHKLGLLQINDNLDQSAQMKANDLVANNYWDHVSPTGVTPWHWFDVVGYNYVDAAENLARCYDNADKTVEAWMNSPEHRAAILKPDYTEMGFGISQRADGCVIVVNHFAQPK